MSLVLRVYDPDRNPVLVGIGVKNPATDSRRHLFPRGDVGPPFAVSRVICVPPVAWPSKSSYLARQRPSTILAQCEIVPSQRGLEKPPCPIDAARTRDSPFRVDGSGLIGLPFH